MKKSLLLLFCCCLYSAAPASSSSSSDLSSTGGASAAVDRSAQEVLAEHAKYEADLNAAITDQATINRCCTDLAVWSGAKYKAKTHSVTKLTKDKKGLWPKSGDIPKLLGGDNQKITKGGYGQYFDHYSSNLDKVNAVARCCGMKEVAKHNRLNTKDLPATRDAFEQLRIAMEDALVRATEIAKAMDTKVQRLEAQAPGVSDKDSLKSQARNERRQEKTEAREREDRLAGERRLQEYVGMYVDGHLAQSISEFLPEYIRNSGVLSCNLTHSVIPLVRDQMLQKTVDLAKQWYQERVVVEYTGEVFDRWDRESEAAMQNDLESVFVAKCRVTGILGIEYDGTGMRTWNAMSIRMRTWNAFNMMIKTREFMGDFSRVCGVVRKKHESVCASYASFERLIQDEIENAQEKRAQQSLERRDEQAQATLDEQAQATLDEQAQATLDEYIVQAIREQAQEIANALSPGDHDADVECSSVSLPEPHTIKDLQRTKHLVHCLAKMRQSTSRRFHDYDDFRTNLGVLMEMEERQPGLSLLPGTTPEIAVQLQASFTDPEVLEMFTHGTIELG